MLLWAKLIRIFEVYFKQKPTKARDVSATRVPLPETSLLLSLIGGELPLMDAYKWTGLVVFARNDWSLQYVTEHRDFLIHESTKGAALFAGREVFISKHTFELFLQHRRRVRGLKSISSTFTCTRRLIFGTLVKATD